MPIEVGQSIPNATLMQRQEDKTNKTFETTELFKGRKIALSGMPGAFTGTCTGEHVPSFIRRAKELKAKGVDEIIIFAVNDPQVMKAWGEATGGTDAGLTFLADPMCEFTEALGLRFDAPQGGLIARCVRFAAIVENGVIKTLKFEEAPLGCSLTSGDSILEALD